MNLLSFLSAPVLWGLLALPILWVILRTLPPPPRPIILPTAHFLQDLISHPSITITIPWWLRMIRIMLAACIVFFLAHPFIQPENKAVTVTDSLILVIENNWASAKNWPEMIQTAQRLIDQAASENKIVTLITTAALEPDSPPLLFSANSAKSASEQLKTIKPVPWPSALSFVEKTLSNIQNGQLVWIGTGIDEGGLNQTLRVFKGEKFYFGPDLDHLPVLLKSADRDDYLSLRATIAAPQSQIKFINARLHDEKGAVLQNVISQIAKGETSADIKFNPEESAQARPSYITLSREATAASTVLLPTRSPKRNVVLIGDDTGPSANTYLDDVFYLKHALEKISTLKILPLENIDLEHQDIIVAPDLPISKPDLFPQLQEWLEAGGILLRFSGPKLSNAPNDPFLPVPLAQGSRSLNSSFALEKPLSLRPLAQTSPLAGVPALETIVVKEQVLAQSLPENDPLIWATLSDGTPFITARKVKNGLIILVHSSAGPSWCNLSLSGSFIPFLKTVLDLSPTKLTAHNSAQMLEFIKGVDANGLFYKPTSIRADISKDTLMNSAPSAQTPPGLYGGSGKAIPYNLAEHIPVTTMASLSPPVTSLLFNTQPSVQDLRPALILFALLLCLLDMLLTTALKYRKISLLCFLILAIIPTNVYAYDGKLSLAFIQSGNALVDTQTQIGLTSLANILAQRTAITTDTVIALNPEKLDSLALYPLVYWPISPETPTLSPASISHVQSFLDRGGTILFDTRDQYFQQSAENTTYSRNAKILKDLLQPLVFAPVLPIPKDHVLHRTFYLLDEFPGTYKSGTLFLALDGTQDRDGVSSVIIGSNDYGAGWATLNDGINTYDEELAARTGINIILYALTGNYKTDQIHLQKLLDRMTPFNSGNPL